MLDKLPFGIDAESVRVLFGGAVGGLVLGVFQQSGWKGVVRFAVIGGAVSFYTAAAVAPTIAAMFVPGSTAASGAIGFSAFIMGIGAPSFVELVITAFRVRRDRMKGGGSTDA